MHSLCDVRAIERCNFDQARLIRHNRILAANGIAPDGMSIANVPNGPLTFAQPRCLRLRHSIGKSGR